METRGITRTLYYGVLLPVVGMLMLFSSCARDVKTQKLSKEVNLKQYDTYAWLPGGDTTNNAFSVDPTVSSAIRNKVNKELQQKGYRLHPQNPDFLVLVHTNYNRKVNLKTIPANYGYYSPGFYTGAWYNEYYPYYDEIGYIDGPDVKAVDYTKGTVVIDIIDTHSRKIVWRGKASEPIYNQDQLKEEVAENVEEILEEFPG